MSALSLIPNPVIVAVEGGFFIAAYVVVKHLYIKPYVSMRTRRLAATTGSKDSAVLLLQENERLEQEIKDKLSKALTTARANVEEAKLEASKKRQTIVKSAEADAQKTLDALRQELQKNIAEERINLPAVVSKLSGLLYDKLWSH